MGDRCEAHGLVYVIEGDQRVCPLCDPVLVAWADLCEAAVRALDHQAAHEVVNAMAAHLRGKAQGLRLAVSLLKEAHQSVPGTRPANALDFDESTGRS